MGGSNSEGGRRAHGAARKFNNGQHHHRRKAAAGRAEVGGLAGVSACRQQLHLTAEGVGAQVQLQPCRHAIHIDQPFTWRDQRLRDEAAG